jgi:hypothetical protein
MLSHHSKMILKKGLALLITIASTVLPASSVIAQSVLKESNTDLTYTETGKIPNQFTWLPYAFSTPSTDFAVGLAGGVDSFLQGASRDI